MTKSSKEYIRPLDIRKEHHRHSFEKYQSYDRFIIDEKQYEKIALLLKEVTDQLIVEVESPYLKGVIVAKQPQEEYVMHYVFDIEHENNVIHAFNKQEGFMFSLEFQDGKYVTKNIHPLLRHMPKVEFESFQSFATNYYYSLMFYLSHTKGINGLSCTEDKYLKKKKKGKKKVSKWQVRNRYSFAINWRELLPSLEEIKKQSKTKEEARQVIEAIKKEDKKVTESKEGILKGISVKGHYRTLKNGEKVWIDGYIREKKGS